MIPPLDKNEQGIIVKVKPGLKGYVHCSGQTFKGIFVQIRPSIAFGFAMKLNQLVFDFQVTDYQTIFNRYKLICRSLEFGRYFEGRGTMVTYF